MPERQVVQHQLFEQQAQGTVMPLGKYKDKPIEILLTDPEYVTYLMGTMRDKLRTRYPAVFQFIVAHYGEPSRTPEHNALQNRFLKREFQLKFALAVKPDIANWVILDRIDLNQQMDRYLARRVDEFLSLQRGAAEAELPAYRKKELDSLAKHGRFFIGTGKVRDSFIEGPVEVSNLKFEEGGSDVVFVLRHSWEFLTSEREGDEADWSVISVCNSSVNARVQIKPVLGDDYPAVLRSMKAVHSNQLLVRDYTGVGATWDEVKQVFALDNIHAVLLQEVDAVVVPDEFERVRCPVFIPQSWPRLA